MTVAVTLFALLELYKRGEASWEQGEPFGPITVQAVVTPLAKIVEALLFLSPEPVSLDDLRDATQQDEWAVLDALTELRDGLHGRGVVLKEIGGGWTLASHPGAEEAARRLLVAAPHADAHAGPGRDAVRRRLPAAGLAAGDGPHPRRRVGVRDRRAAPSAA